MNCYKIIFDSFPFCLFTYWVGSGAKWFDDCTPSDAESVKIWTWNVNESTRTSYWYGGNLITSEGCVKVITENTRPFNEAAINMIFGYLDFVFGIDELSHIPNEIMYVPGL